MSVASTPPRVEWSRGQSRCARVIRRGVTPFGCLQSVERHAVGEPCLAWLAADLGFADHAHRNRIVRGQLGQTPTRLRRLLRAG
jgi:hypothetical protein